MINLPRPTRDNGGFQPKIAQEVNPNVAILNSSTLYSLVHYRAACLPGALRYDPTAWQSDALQVQYPPPSHPLPRLPGHQAPWGPVWCAHAISRGKGVRCPPSRIFFSADQMAIYIFSPEMLKILTTRVQSRFRGVWRKSRGRIGTRVCLGLGRSALCSVPYGAHQSRIATASVWLQVRLLPTVLAKCYTLCNVGG